MTDGGNGPERVEVTVPTPMPGAPGVTVPVTFSMDNRGRATMPESVGPAVATEIDASSLDSAIRWLEDYAKYMEKLPYRMADIKELMGGVGAGAGVPAGGGQASPLGGFPWAVELAQKHASLYSGIETSAGMLSKRLYEAARALKKVKENYESAEGANRMSATDMKQVFADVARNQA